MLIRLVEGVEGAVEMESVLRLRFGYGRIVPWVMRSEHSIRAVAGPDSVCFFSPVPNVGRNLAHQATFTVQPGDRLPFVLCWQPSHLPPATRRRRRGSARGDTPVLVRLVGQMQL